MFAVVIPTLNDEATLVEALAALVPASAEGIVREVIITDAGSGDATETIADAAGCQWIRSNDTRGGRLAAGAASARRGEWLLFLEPDTVLEPGWYREVASFVERVERTGRGDRVAACFQFANDDLGLKARFSETCAWLRTRVLGIGHAHHGLVVSRRLYARLGGHRADAGLPDADLVRRIGRRHMTHLPVRAVRRVVADEHGNGPGLRGALGVLLFMLRVPGPLIGRLVGSPSR